VLAHVRSEKAAADKVTMAAARRARRDNHATPTKRSTTWPFLINQVIADCSVLSIHGKWIAGAYGVGIVVEFNILQRFPASGTVWRCRASGFSRERAG